MVKTARFTRAHALADLCSMRAAGEALPLVYPVLVSRPIARVDEVLAAAIVYPIMSMACRPSGDGQLPDEIGRLLVGRTGDGDVVIDDTNVSRRHGALIRRQEGRWSVVDFGSTNSTFVNGIALEPGRPVELVPVATVRFGPTATFALMDEDHLLAHLDSLRGEVEKRPERTTHRGRVSAAIAERVVTSAFPRLIDIAWRSPTDELIGARILDAARASRVNARGWRITIDGGVVEEIADWTSLVGFIEKCAARIASVAAVPQGVGRPIAIYERRAH